MKNRYNNLRNDAYNVFKVEEPSTLLPWLLANLKESRNKVKATLQNRGIKVNGKFITQYD